MRRLQHCLLLLVLATPTPTLASDGVLEINQTCAVETGCFAGDTAGFPVTIDGSAGTSYALTGSLDLSAFTATSAISIQAPFASLDLGGFEVAGPTVCTFDGFALSCTPTGTTPGIQISGRSVSVRNGTIRGISGSGIEGTANGIRIDGVNAVSNAGHAVRLDENSLVLNTIAMENADGISVGANSVVNRCISRGNGLKGIEGRGPRVVVSESNASANGLRAFDLDHSSRYVSNTSDSVRGNILESTCGGGVCSEARRFYLSQGAVRGDAPLTACAAGFHMASLWEIHDTASLRYDSRLGQQGADVGSGPNTLYGFVRTGNIQESADATALAGDANCNAWTSSL